MRFEGIAFWDGFFSFNDPWMMAGAIYGCLWLALAVTLLVLRSRETGFPNLLRLSLYFLAGQFIVVPSIVLAIINASLPPNESFGLLSGPPLWISTAGIAIGLVLGWTFRYAQGKGSRAEKPNGPEGRAIGLKSMPVALALSFCFPGLGQIYLGRFFLGLLALLALCFFTQMLHIWGFIAVFVLIQAALITNKALGRLLNGLRAGPGPDGRSGR